MGRGAHPAERRWARSAHVLLAAFCAFGIGAAPANAATLKHWWKADNDAVDAVDANNGALVGNTTFTTGALNQAFSFDGSGDYVSVPDAASHYPSGSFAVDLFAKTAVGTGLQMFFSVYECANFCPSSMANSNIDLELFNGIARGFVRDADGGGPDSGGQLISGGPSFADSAFHHYFFVRDVEATKLALYVDGIEIAEQDLNPAMAGALANTDGEADPLTIGAYIEGGLSTPNGEVNGAVDEVKLWEGAEYPDKTPPSIAAAVSGQGENGWLLANGEVAWNVSDESILRGKQGCDTTAIPADTASQTLTCTASSAGGQSSQSVTIKRDATPPVLTCAGANPAFGVGQAGQRVSVTVTDGLSGPATATASAPADTATAGAQTTQITGFDNAGNSADISCPYTVEPAPVQAATVQPAVITITNLNQCLRIGPFTYRFKVPLKKLQGSSKVNRRSRVTIVKFTLDGKRDGSDKKRPFIAKINTSALSDGQHVLTADVLLQVPRTGKRFHRKQRFPFNTCA
jgi:hypothetical protein